MQTKKIILMIVAVIISLSMLRLGVWQLDRAEQKRTILSQSKALSELPAVAIQDLVDAQNLTVGQRQSGEPQLNIDESRFRQVVASGRYLNTQSILIDNQVYESKVGYALLTPFKLDNSELIVLVDRGWLPVGESRQKSPVFETSALQQTLSGRLNRPYAQPPIWNDEFPVSQGMVWQFLPIEKFRQQTGLDVLPLMLELAPVELANETPSSPKINWQSINDESVFKHQAYAFQWFCMAFVFFLACLIMLIKSMRKVTDD